MEKPFQTLDRQVELLRKRGLDIGDRDQARQLLHRLNYYRISGYGRQFQEDPSVGKNDFVDGTTLSRLVQLLALDTQLRLLCTEALSEIEIGVRSRFAHEAGSVYGDAAFYLEPASYLDITPDLGQHIGKIRRELSRPKLKTVERYRVGDDLSKVPIWVAIELISFGALAKMMWYLNDPRPSHATADAMRLQHSGFASTIHSFAVLRNACAHHGQLWHRNFDVLFATRTKEKKREPSHTPSGAYTGIVVIKRFLRAMDVLPDWQDRVNTLLDSDTEFRGGILRPSPR